MSRHSLSVSFPRSTRVAVRAFSLQSHATRGDFARLTPDDARFFRGLLGDAGVVADPAQLAKYNTDWLKNWKGQSTLAIRCGSHHRRAQPGRVIHVQPATRPKTTDEVSKVLKYCNERRLAVVPQVQSSVRAVLLVRR